MNDQFMGFGFLKMTNPDGTQMTEVPTELRDAYLTNPANIVGAPDRVRDRLESSLDLGIDLLIVRTIWANFKSERALCTMETFAHEVMPWVREVTA